MSRDQCQEALVKWVDTFCCKGSRAAKQGHLTDVWTYNALEVKLFLMYNKESNRI